MEVDGDEITISSKEFSEIKRERRFYRRAIRQQQKKLNKLDKKNTDKYWKNKRLLRENRRIKESYNSLLNSSSWIITKPLRGLKRIFKR